MATKGKKQPLPRPNGKPQKKQVPKQPVPEASETPPAIYNYTDAAGDVVYRVLRYSSTDVRAQRPTKNGGWRPGLAGVGRLLYGGDRLASLKGKVIFLCEDERDAEAAWALRVEATCWFGGANGWRQEFRDFFAGKYVIILPHNDEDGRTFATHAFAGVASVAVDAVILPLPNLEEHGGLAGFVAQGGTMDDLYRLTQEAFDAAAPRPPANLEADELVEDVPLPIEAAAAGEAAEVAADIHDSEAAAKTSHSESNGREKRFADWALLHLVKQLPQKWLWEGRIPADALTLLYGAPGVGKSFVSIDIAARVSSGRNFPDGKTNDGPGDVILLTGEDRIETTVKSRMQWSQGNEERVAVLRGTTIIEKDGKRTLDPFALQDLRPLVEVLDHLKRPRLVIIDPISMVSGGIDDHKNQEVRRMLAGLRSLCEERELAALIITHPNKGTGPALNRIAGSIALGAAVRAAWCVCRDDEDSSGKNRLFLCAKPSLSQEPTGLSYQIVRISDASEGANVSWGEKPIMRTADEAMADDQIDAIEHREERRRERRESEREGMILNNIDKLPKDTEGYVAVKDIKETTGINGSRLAASIDRLEEEGIIESKYIPLEVGQGATRSRGSKLVRRRSPEKEQV